MVIKLRNDIICINDKNELNDRGLSEDYVLFEDHNYSMVLRLHRSEIDKFIKYRPNRVLTDKRFYISSSNYINDIELDVIIDYLNKEHKKRKYKTVSDLVSSKTRLVNKKKMLIEDYTTAELAEFIENKKKGETVCQS